MELDEALTTTRAVRKRLDLERPVDREVVEECLELALQAPNGSNMQLWRWVLVDDPELRSKMADTYRASIDGYRVRPGAPPPTPEGGPRSPEAIRMTESVMHLHERLQDVPLLVVPVVAGRMEHATVFDQASMWGSVIPAAWSFMLALRSRGLGTAWTTIHLHREQEMAELLGIPYDEYTQAGLFPVAYTVGTEFQLADRSASEELIYWNQFGRRA